MLGSAGGEAPGAQRNFPPSAAEAPDVELFLGGVRLSRRCLKLGLEQVFVDLALIDGHALFDADSDHFLPVEPELLREFFGREVIRHVVQLLPGTKKPAARNALAG